MIFGKKGKNKLLNERLAVMHADMENNYKDAAQMDYKRVKELYEQLIAEGKLSAKEAAYYKEQIDAVAEEMKHFTHFEGPGTGRYQSR